MNDEVVIVMGITNDGERFRPTNWCRRLASAYAHMDHNKRLRYHKHLNPCIIEDYSGLAVGKELETTNPEMFNHIITFAKDNNLKIVDGRRETVRDQAA